MIKYLEFCVYKQSCPDQAIHNLLLSLYAKYKQDEVLRYIGSQGILSRQISMNSWLMNSLILIIQYIFQGQDITMVHYDVHYALRLCQENGLTEACVQLSALLGLWTTAVDLALTIDVDLAKIIAAMPSHNDNELKKKLWLKIGNSVFMEMQLSYCDSMTMSIILEFRSTTIDLEIFSYLIFLLYCMKKLSMNSYTFSISQIRFCNILFVFFKTFPSCKYSILCIMGGK